MKTQRALLLALLLPAGTVAASPYTLELRPSADPIQPGGELAVEIHAAGFDDADLGGFDLDLTFDPTLLRFDGYALGTALLDPDWGQDDLSAGETTPGLVNVAEVSGLLDFTGQPDAFLLATLSFTGTERARRTSLSLSRYALTDDLGFDLAVETPNATTVGVPAPAPWLLLPSAIAALLARRRRPGRGE